MDWENRKSIIQVTQLLRGRVEAVSRGSISGQQTESLKEPPVKPPTLVSKFTLPKPPEDDARQLLFRVIETLGEGEGQYCPPQSLPVDAEWTGNCENSANETSKPDMTENDKYGTILKESTSPVVVFFIYGGAYYLNSPASYTRTTGKLAKMTGGHCITVRQRLAPQNPFPAALLDVFTAYLSLLAPPPGSFHKAVAPSSIVFAGDSSGGGLALALLQVLLTIKRQGWASSFRFHGKEVDLALPAGLTLLSACADFTESLPSHVLNAKYDIFANVPPSLQPGFPTCDIWPSKPPRGNMYCEGSMAGHPLISPVTAKDWSGAPPIWLVCGQEQMVDGVKVIAQNVYRQGVSVVFKEFEAMPHCWTFFYAGSVQSVKCWIEWAQVCRQLAEGKGLLSTATFVEAEGMKEKKLDPGSLIDLSMDDVQELVKKGCAKYSRPFTGHEKASL